MKIRVGSKNSTKINAVKELIASYKAFAGADVEGVDVQVETFGHPRTLDEVVAGAVDRAKQAFTSGDYGFGIEGGMFAVPQTKTGYMEIAVCAIWDGKEVCLGMSPAYEWPIAVADGILDKGLDGSQALKAAGLTTHDKIGAAEGGIFLLTNGRMNRTDLNRSAVMMALIQLEHPQQYGSVI